MEGIITVDASREEVERLKAWRAEQAKKVANKSNAETIIDRVFDITKCVVEFAGTVATIALTICPLDGPAGEIAMVAATPGLVAAVESGRKLVKGVFVEKDTEQISAALADIKGNVKDISIKDINLLKTKKVSDETARPQVTDGPVNMTM
jgi:hypothetical protein